MQIEPAIRITTINWRIYNLVESGVINRIGRGKYALGPNRIFSSDISPKIELIHTKLINEFPYLEICIWDTSCLNKFMIHQPGRFYLLIEVDKSAAQSVFFNLRENKYPVFIHPTMDLIEKYLPEMKETVIVSSLVTESPLQLKNGIIVPTIEKILVDIFCDDVIFSAQQGSEMRTIFEEAIKNHTVNENRLIRYADRRGRKESFREYLNKIFQML